MPVYQLPDDELVFPHPELANENGLLAVGGDLSAARLVLAYSNGIFPWYNEGEPILWWSPDPRLVLFPREFKRHKSLHLLVNKKRFEVTFNSAFKEVIKQCGRVPRKGQPGTWITKEMEIAYIKLHNLQIAQSVEVWEEGKLVGGLYGLLLGKVFFGESMFHTVDNASKVAFWHLIDKLIEQGVQLVDAQQDTPHLRSLGARPVPRKEFLKLLKKWV